MTAEIRPSEGKTNILYVQALRREFDREVAQVFREKDHYLQRLKASETPFAATTGAFSSSAAERRADVKIPCRRVNYL